MNQAMNRAMIRIGSRGSQLALWQANSIAAALRGLDHQVAIEIIRTTGDRAQGPSFNATGAKGIFTREIEEALLAGRIDLAVHSLKDLPTEIAGSFTLAAIPKRADPRDALVSQRYHSIEALPLNAVIGTGSLRRRAQLSSLRPGLKYIEFRGNVDTRLEKLAQGKADAIVLAAAGLDRLDKTEWIRQRFSPEALCPAAGQGAMAIECRAEDARMRSILQPLDHRETRRAVTAERSLLAALGGGCEVPIGAYAQVSPSDGNGASGELRLVGVVASADGSQIVRGEIHGEAPGPLGEQLARQLLAQGAGVLLGIEADAV